MSTPMSLKNIFICYRRDDAEGYAGRLYDRLNSRFPRHVFMDVTGISPGADFTRVIQDRVGSCHVLIAIIGRHWATVTDASNRRRLDLADDYVRHEIATALSRNITVIPVLVRGGQMPSRDVLPPDLAELSTRNALEITDGDFDHDVHRLIQVLEDLCGETRPVAAPATQPRRNNCLIFTLIGLLVGGAIVGVLVLLGVLAASSQSDPGYVQPSPQPAHSPVPSSERTEAPDAQVTNEFHPVGRWILTATSRATGVTERTAFELHQDKTYDANGEIGDWDYSPNEGKLTMERLFVITIEGREGNSFLGSAKEGDATYIIRLTPNSNPGRREAPTN